MRTPPSSARWLTAGAAACLWAWVAGSATLWWLHLPQPGDTNGSPAEPASLARAQPLDHTAGHVLRALGQRADAAVAPEAGQRFQLLGVIAARSGQGSALLAVDGQPPQAFVQGQWVTEDWRLLSVDAQGARLSSRPHGAPASAVNGAQLTLSLPEAGPRAVRP